MNLDASGLEFTKYYGYGNQTAFDVGLEKNDFYKLEEKLFSIHSSVEFHLSKFSELSFGVGYYYSEAELQNEFLLNSFPYQKYGLGNFDLFSLSTGFIFDNRNNISNPNKGVYLNLIGEYSPMIFSNDKNFSKMSADFRYYITVEPFLKTTFAIRGVAEKVFGKHPFLSSAFLGGPRNLLGYSRERFSGDTSLFSSVDMHTTLGTVKLLINGKLGFHVFGSTGRVFAQNDVSDKWHPSYGGGLWIAYLNRAVNIVLTFAHSVEANYLYGGLAFSF